MVNVDDADAHICASNNSHQLHCEKSDLCKRFAMLEVLVCIIFLSNHIATISQLSLCSATSKRPGYLVRGCIGYHRHVAPVSLDHADCWQLLAIHKRADMFSSLLCQTVHRMCSHSLLRSDLGIIQPLNATRPLEDVWEIKSVLWMGRRCRTFASFLQDKPLCNYVPIIN